MENNDKIYLSADAYLRDVWRLAAAVRSSEWKPDLLLALWRGGAPVGMALHEYLKVSGWSVEHLPLKCASYTGIGENHGGVVFSFGDEIFASLKAGERVLVVDDVFDTGKTAAAIASRLKAAGTEMKMACVYWKPEKNTTELKPDYFVRKIGLEWVVFPHEIEGLTPREIAQKDMMLAECLNGVMK